jgi:hypothetical protein
MNISTDKEKLIQEWKQLRSLYFNAYNENFENFRYYVANAQDFPSYF